MRIRKKGSVVSSPNSGRKKWKPLQLNEAILSGGIEGLVGIEELVEYKPTIVQKEANRSVVKSETGKTKNAKHMEKKVWCDDENLITRKNSLKSKKGKKYDMVLQKRAVNKAKLHKKFTQDEHNSLVINNSNKKKDILLTEENYIQNTVNKFLQCEQLEFPMPSALKALRKKKQTKEKKSKHQKSVIDLVESSKEISSCSQSRNKKRSQSPKLLHKELTSKRVKQQFEPSKIEQARCNVSEHIHASKIVKNKKKTRSVGIAKKKTSSANLHSNVRDNENMKLETSDPVTGMEEWNTLNLPESILRALAEKGFTSPTEIQSLTLPAAVLGRRDIMGAAETGSGKTLAFGIPIIYGILQQKKKEARFTEINLEIEQHEFPATTKDFTNEDTASEDSENVMEEAEHSKMDEGDDVKYESDNISEYEIEGINENALGIGCVKVIDNVDMSKISTQTENTSNKCKKGRLYALVLTPTRELAVQVKDHLKDAAKYTGIKVAVVIGGLSLQKQERLLKAAPEIVVATPGRLWEMIQEGNAHLQQVDKISFLAIDETDRMVEQGHFQELRELLERINEGEVNKTNRQNFVFSATLTSVHEPPHRKKSKQKKQLRVTPGQKLQEVITMVGMSNPKVVDITRETGTCGTLEEAQISCTFEEKDIYLYYFLIKHAGRTLVFCNSISCVRRLAQLLTILMCKPLPIHANMIQRQRLRNLDKFRDSPTGLLLATDVAARGLDIPDVQHVIHYQVPRTSESYIHRSGRTARASKEGLTLLLVEPNEQQTYARLCRTLGRNQQLPTFPVSQDLYNAAKQRMHLARDIDQLELSSRRADSENGWFQKAMSDMDILLDDDDIPKRISKEDSIGNRQLASKKRKQLDMLLSRPLFSVRV